MAKTNFQYEKRQKDLEKKRKKEEKLKKKADKNAAPTLDADGNPVEVDESESTAGDGVDNAEDPTPNPESDA